MTHNSQTNPQSFSCLVREEGIDKEQDHKICFKNAFCFWSQEEKRGIAQGTEWGFQYNDPFITCITIKSSYSFSMLPYHNPISS